MSCAPPPVSYADPTDVGQLAEPLRSRIAALIGHAPTGGLVLISGRRSPYQQWLLRHQRCPGQECDPACAGRPRTALPGASNHQRGTAADLGGRELAWARSVMRLYGLHTPVTGEAWHFEVDPAVPPSVSIPTWRPSGPGHASWQPIRPGDTDQTIAARGGYDNEVSELQIRLHALAASWGDPALEPGPVDGDYGPTSQAAVVRFHRRILALQQATHQPLWPSPDRLIGPKKRDMLRWWTA